MAERIPPLTPRQSRAVARYEETKRLAEMAWVALLTNHSFSQVMPAQLTVAAWADAEAMYAESERRRPQE